MDHSIYRRVSLQLILFIVLSLSELNAGDKKTVKKEISTLETTTIGNDTQVNATTAPPRPIGITRDLNDPLVLQFEVIEYMTNKTIEQLPKHLSGRRLSFVEFYLHVYFILKLDEVNTVSAVTYVNGTLDGASLVVKFPQLTRMYAPEIIGKVIKFTRKCYIADLTMPLVRNSWILQLLGCGQSESCKAILTRTVERFRRLPLVERVSGLYTFQSKKHMGKILLGLGFEERTCGGGCRNQSRYISECDWKVILTDPRFQRDICLYHLN